MDTQDLTQRHLLDLARAAEQRNRIQYSDFLSLAELNILYDLQQKFSWIRGKTFGGYKGAERQIAAFLPDYGGEPDLFSDMDGTEGFPITCIHIRADQKKFAEKLSHRDVLGALMNLGIDRSKTGDIAVLEAEAYLFCISHMADLICRELTRIRHTSVTCSICDPGTFEYKPALERVRSSVSSIRLDSVMAAAFGASRSSLIQLIEGGCTYVNGRLITTNACSLHEGDLISVRGHGRFRFVGSSGTSKKGRTWIEIDRYV